MVKRRLINPPQCGQIIGPWRCTPIGSYIPLFYCFVYWRRKLYKVNFRCLRSVQVSDRKQILSRLLKQMKLDTTHSNIMLARVKKKKNMLHLLNVDMSTLRKCLYALYVRRRYLFHISNSPPQSLKGLASTQRPLPVFVVFFRVDPSPKIL